MIITTLLSSCEFASMGKHDGPIVAEAFGQKLYEDELDAYLQNITSASDSQYIISMVVDEWLKDQIIYEEARSKLRNKAHIQDMVEDYKQSLIINEWENMYLRNELDTVISSQEINSFFRFHRTDFLLEEPIIRFFFVRLPGEFDKDSLEDLWETEDLPALKTFCTHNGGYSILEPDEWYNLSVLKSIAPTELFAKISLKKPANYTTSIEDGEFYLKVLEIIDDKDEIPVSFVKERIKLRILQDRKKALVKMKKAALFEEKIKSKEIKIYGKAGK